MSSLVGAPGSKRPEQSIADGVIVKTASLKRVRMRVVKCDAEGTDSDSDSTGRYSNADVEDYSHVKTAIQALHLGESRPNTEAGQYDDMPVTLKAAALEKISDIKLFVNGQELSMSRRQGQFEFLMAKSAAVLPLQAMLSVEYTSPLGGTWEVKNHPVVISFQDPKASGCCAVM